MGRVADFFREQNITLDGQKKTKMLSLDQEVVSIESERDVLKAENLQIKADVKPLERENKRLQERLKEQSTQERFQIDNHAERLLIFLARIGEAKTSKQLQDELGLNQPRIEYYLREMFQRDYLGVSRRTIEGYTTYVLGHKGNEFLVKKGHV